MEAAQDASSSGTCSYPLHGHDHKSENGDPAVSGDSLRSGKDCLRKAGMLLAQRDYTCRRLREKLLAGGFDLKTVEETLESLIEARYVDDRRFAYNYVQLHREDRSRLRIRTDLENRGVPDDVISEVMREESEEHGTQAEVRQILKLMRKRGLKKNKKKKKERRKMQAYLYRKGYAASSVRSAMSADLLDSDGFSV